VANKYKGTDKDIHKRIYNCVIGCFRDVIKKIPKTTENIPLISQISSSLTSIGANDREADACGSQRDFVAKLYWLSLVRDLKLVEPDIVSKYLQECNEIFRIVSTIIKNARTTV
jgi:four helix bundle protein